MSTSDSDRRLDSWLFRTRFFKKRSDAASLVEKGKVRLTRNGVTQRMNKPGYRVSENDEISFMRGSTLFQIKVIGFPQRRGPASKARQHYCIIDTQNCDRDGG